jgi:hypothetical protein
MARDRNWSSGIFRSSEHHYLRINQNIYKLCGAVIGGFYGGRIFFSFIKKIGNKLDKAPNIYYIECDMN